MYSISSISDKLWSFNGNHYPKAYQAIPTQDDRLKIINVTQRTSEVGVECHFSEIEVEGTTYENIKDTINALNEIVWGWSGTVGGSTTLSENITKVGGVNVPVVNSKPALPSVILDENGAQITQFGLSANVPVTAAVKATPTAIVDATGNQITSFGSPSTSTPRFSLATNTSTGTITLSTTGLGLTSPQVKAIIIVNETTHVSSVLVQGNAGYTFQIVGDIISVYKDGNILTTLAVGEKYVVQYESTSVGTDLINDMIKVYDKSPARYHAITHWSPVHGTATYASNTTLNLVFPFTVDDASCTIAAITVFNVDPSIAPKIYEQGINGISIRVTNDVLTLYGAGTAPFTNSVNETYRVAISAYPQAIDPSFDAQKVINLNLDSNKSTLNSLMDGAAAFTHTGNDATFAVTVTRGVVSSVAVTSGGTLYPASKTAGEIYIALDFNSGMGCVIRCNSDASGVLSVYSSATACIVYPGSGYTANGVAIVGLLYEELPTFAGISTDGNNSHSFSGFLSHGTTAGGVIKFGVQWTNDEDVSTTTSAKWSNSMGIDTDLGTLVKEIVTTADVDKVFGFNLPDFKVKNFRCYIKYQKSIGNCEIKSYSKV